MNQLTTKVQRENKKIKIYPFLIDYAFLLCIDFVENLSSTNIIVRWWYWEVEWNKWFFYI